MDKTEPMDDETLAAIERAAYLGDPHRKPEADVRALLMEVHRLRDKETS